MHEQWQNEDPGPQEASVNEIRAELEQAKSDLRATYELIKTLEGLAKEARIFMEKRGLIDGD